MVAHHDTLRTRFDVSNGELVQGIDLPIRALFEHAATLAGMPRVIEAERSDNATVDDW